MDKRLTSMTGICDFILSTDSKEEMEIWGKKGRTRVQGKGKVGRRGLRGCPLHGSRQPRIHMSLLPAAFLGLGEAEDKE